MYFVPVTQSQNKILNTQESRTCLKVEPGAGATYALLLKGIKEAMDDKFVIYFGTWPTHPGGSVDLTKKILDDLGVKYRFSCASNTFTLSALGRLKLVPKTSLDITPGADWVLYDHGGYGFNSSNRGKRFIVTCYANDTSFDILDTIEMRLQDNFFIKEECPQYEKLARDSIPERFFQD